MKLTIKAIAAGIAFITLAITCGQPAQAYWFPTYTYTAIDSHGHQTNYTSSGSRPVFSGSLYGSWTLQSITTTLTWGPAFQHDPATEPATVTVLEDSIAQVDANDIDNPAQNGIVGLSTTTNTGLLDLLGRADPSQDIKAWGFPSTQYGAKSMGGHYFTMNTNGGPVVLPTRTVTGSITYNITASDPTGANSSYVGYSTVEVSAAQMSGYTTGTAPSIGSPAHGTQPAGWIPSAPSYFKGTNCLIDAYGGGNDGGGMYSFANTAWIYSAQLQIDHKVVASVTYPNTQVSQVHLYGYFDSTKYANGYPIIGELDVTDYEGNTYYYTVWAPAQNP